jgi:arylsulfatase A-like enzyme
MSGGGRWHALRVVGAVVVAACAQAVATRAGAADTGLPRANVLCVVVDDLNDWVGCLGGHPDVRTPHLDRLAARGMLFTNAHCPAPVCNPSRVAVLTGRAPHTTGIHDNAVIWHEALGDVPTLPGWFRRHGAFVAGGGKVWHHMPGFNRPGDWDEWFAQIFDGPYQHLIAAGGDPRAFRWPAGFPRNGLAAVRDLARPPDNAREFDWGPLDAADEELGDGRMVAWAERVLRDPPREPFFLATGIYAPHLPWYSPRRYFDMYPPETITPPAVKADDCADLPPAGQRMAAARRGDLELVRAAGQERAMLRGYLASISFCDALVGRLTAALDASPARDRTIVVLWSDHGWHLGEKDHLHKFTLWERSTRVPLVVVAPGVTAAGSRCARPVGLIDLFPTLVDLAGLPAPPGLDGRSLRPLLDLPERPWDHPALTTHGRGNHTLRDERWRYIRYADGGEELYDHAADPHEWTNLAGRPEHAAVQGALAARLPVSEAPDRPAKGGRKRARAAAGADGEEAP